MKVLQASILLLVDAPITCWMAIDTRCVVTSINDHFGVGFQNAGIDGYRYLEKIIQLPFCLPDLSTEAKKNYMLKMLEGQELTSLRVYKRLNFILGGPDREKVLNVFSSETVSRVLSSNAAKVQTEDQAIQSLIPVLNEMHAKDIFLNDSRANDFEQVSGYGPNQVAVQCLDLRVKSSEEVRRLRDQFNHWITLGIDVLLYQNIPDQNKEIPRDKESHHSEKEVDDFSSFPDEENSMEETDPLLPDKLNCSDDKNSKLKKSVSKTASDDSVVADSQMRDDESFHDDVSNIYGDPMPNLSVNEIDTNHRYTKVYQPLVTSVEREWFIDLIKYMNGSARKLKRILNSYMVA